MKNVLIIMTGTVSPGQMTFTNLLDPEIRRGQYLSSLNFWLTQTDLPILFIENSETDLSKQINPKYSGRVEFLTFNGNDYSKELGKGYGEMRCLHYALENSVFFKNCDFIFKVTGRLKVKNFKRFEKHYLEHSDIFVFLDFLYSLTFADSRFFGFNPLFLKQYLIGYQNKINDTKGMIFENILAKATLEAIIDGKTFKQLPFFPEIIGSSGTGNTPYRSDYFYFQFKQLQYFLKSKFYDGK